MFIDLKVSWTVCANKSAYLSKQNSLSEHVQAFSHPLPPTVLVLAKMGILLLFRKPPLGKSCSWLPGLTGCLYICFSDRGAVENINMLSAIYIDEQVRASLSQRVDYLFNAKCIV